MNAGNLNRRIKLQSPNTVPDGMGGRKPATGPSKWADVTTVWAEFKTPKVKELAATGSIISDLIREISIRRRSDIVRGWQVVWRDGQQDHIFFVEHTYNPDFESTVLICREVVRG